MEGSAGVNRSCGGFNSFSTPILGFRNVYSRAGSIIRGLQPGELSSSCRPYRLGLDLDPITVQPPLYSSSHNSDLCLSLCAF